MMMTSHCERLLEVSSMLWDGTQRSCVIVFFVLKKCSNCGQWSGGGILTSERGAVSIEGEGSGERVSPSSAN